MKGAEPSPLGRLARLLVAVTLVAVGGAAAADVADSELDSADALLAGRTGDGLRESFAAYRSVAMRVPGSARAQAGVAISGCLLALYSIEPPHAVLPVAAEAAQAAVRADPKRAHAWAALGLVDYLYEWRWDRAEERFRKALELDPGDAEAHHWYGMMLAALGRFDEAVAAFDHAVAADPSSRIVAVKRGTVLRLAGRLDEAERQLLRARGRFPDMALVHRELGYLRLAQDRREEAVASFERAAALSGGPARSTGGLGYAYAVAGRLEEASELAAAMARRAESEFVPPMYVALVFLGLGETSMALDWLERALDEHDPGLVYVAVKPQYQALRGEPRFAAILRRVGLQ